jgi:nucleoside-diphosphate-sugar epimerase
MSMADTLDIIKEILQSNVHFITEEQRIRPENSEVFRLRGDNSLIKELTGWHPGVTIREGLKKTIDWFTVPENLAKYKSGVYNL